MRSEATNGQRIVCDNDTCHVKTIIRRVLKLTHCRIRNLDLATESSRSIPIISAMRMMYTIKRKFQAVMLGFFLCSWYLPSKQRLLTVCVITGLSMGGHGTMSIAALQPEQYAAGGSTSGVRNIHIKTWKEPEAVAKSRAENFAWVLGPPKNMLNPCTDQTVVGLEDKLKTADGKLIRNVCVDDFLVKPTDICTEDFWLTARHTMTSNDPVSMTGLIGKMRCPTRCFSSIRYCRQTLLKQ